MVKKVREASTEKTKLIGLLRKFLKPSESEDGTFEYADPWGAIAVSKQVDDHFAASHTASVRNGLHGPLRVTKQSRETRFLERLANIEVRLTELEAQVNTLEGRDGS